MNHEIWLRLPENFRKTAVVLFQSQGVDFEKTFITDDSKAVQEQEYSSPWMSRQEASSYAGVSTDTIDNWLKAGKVKYSKLADGRPGRVMIDRNSLRRFLSSRVVANPHRRVRETPMKGVRLRVSR